MKVKGKTTMKKTNKTTYSVRIDKELITDFIGTCQANGLKQGFVLERIIQNFKHNIKSLFQ